MSEAGAGFRYRVLGAINELSATTWDELASTNAANPFLSNAFLSILEDSGCVGGRSGWRPHHLTVLDDTGALAGVAPAFLKSHSQGEYVFDHGWAEAFERAGGRYYPKLQLAVPFTPVPGPRLLARDDNARAALLAAAAQEAQRLNLSSAHITFCTEAETAHAPGWLHRIGEQYHWLNSGFATFDDFLASLQSRKRKLIRRERKDALANDITLHHLTGKELTEAIWDAFFAFYQHTGARKWGSPYLNRHFFSLLGERMGDKVLLVMARRGGRWIAGAMNVIAQDRLLGRYWGAIEHHPFLHFELCYYQAIDAAIARGLAVVEAGAQGEHKLARGYLPVATHSLHFIRHAGFRRAVDDFLEGERDFMRERAGELATLSPYRHALASQSEEAE